MGCESPSVSFISNLSAGIHQDRTFRPGVSLTSLSFRCITGQKSSLCCKLLIQSPVGSKDVGSQKLSSVRTWNQSRTGTPGTLLSSERTLDLWGGCQGQPMILTTTTREFYACQLPVKRGRDLKHRDRIGYLAGCSLLAKSSNFETCDQHVLVSAATVSLSTFLAVRVPLTSAIAAAPVNSSEVVESSTVQRSRAFCRHPKPAKLQYGVVHYRMSQSTSRALPGVQPFHSARDTSKLLGMHTHIQRNICWPTGGKEWAIRHLVGTSCVRMPPFAAFSLPAASAPLPFSAHLDPVIVKASAGASLKLFTLCSFIVWLQKSGRLPETTPSVLSQVAFRVLIPCFLMSKVAITLSSESVTSLAGLPLAALLQVFVGAILGKLLCRLAYSSSRSSSMHKVSAAPAAACAGLSATGGSPVLHTNGRKEALVTAACAFGNSLTLPLVFLSSVLNGPEADRAAGYLALYMIGWSPALWSVGYNIVAGPDASRQQRGEEESDQGDAGLESVWWQAVLRWVTSVMNPPLYGVFVGLLIGATPLSHFFLPSRDMLPLDASGSLPLWAVLSRLTAGIGRPALDAATLLGSATLAVQTIVLASSLAASVPSSFTPFWASQGHASAPAPPLKDEQLTVAVTAADAAAGQEGSSSSPSSSLLDGRALWVISFARLIVMPLAGIAINFVLWKYRLIPLDPICSLTLLVEAAMPSAQNLVLLSQLQASTRPLAAVLASLLLRQYALSVVPITLWMAVFLAITR